MTEAWSSRQTWWVAVKQADGTEAEPEVAQVWFKGTEVEEVLRLGNEYGLRSDQVRLIERVLPAGRAAAAVDRLGEIAGELWPWRVVEEISAILQVEENQS